MFTHIHSQTYSCIYQQTYSDSIITFNQQTKKYFKIPFSNSTELSLVKAGNYGVSFWSNRENSVNRLDGLLDLLSQKSFTLHDYYTHTLWYSIDSSFSGIEYMFVGEGQVLSSKEIRYDLEPGVFIVVDKDLPPAICPDIFISGLKYGVRRFVSPNTVLELKTYQVSQSVPSALNIVANIFRDVSPSSIKRTCPAYFIYQKPSTENREK
jgi:hypothetical protein